MKRLPEFGLLRLTQIIGDKRKPTILPIIPVSRSCWWNGVKRGRFPAPVKLAGGTATFWRVEDICALIEGAEQQRGGNHA
jgi:predicted DNA-binding transcriptional regulator AlpA